MLNYIIVQAGGRGSRLEILTRNKPKALVPVNNLPMIFHLFRKFPDKKFIIIGDYQHEVLEKYLKAFADVDYTVVVSKGHKGTCAGLSKALEHVPEKERFMLIWCDLVLSEEYEIPESDADIIGISKDFSCRWKYENGEFAEERSDKQGVAGLFVFRDKDSLLQGAKLPEEGEFVRWLQFQHHTFEESPLSGTKEYGLYSEWSKLPRLRCRPFNRLDVKGDKVYKYGIDKQGKDLAVREINWYRTIQGTPFKNIPHIFSYDPLCMEWIDGKNIYEYSFIPDEQKKDILQQIIGCLKEVHRLGTMPADRDSFYNAYIGKTFDRLKKVRELVPFANDEYVTINGRRCRNIFYHREEVERLTMQYCPKEFRVIHGDCTFSNTMLRHDTEPVLIDPRGYFGHTEILGDPAYDWVKLYYSLISNYDQFNLKRFTLEINETDIKLETASNNWENMENEFFHLLAGEVTRSQMKLLLALTWLSLTTYAWEDYDSICGAFYQGLYYLEEAFEMESAYEPYFEKNIRTIDSALHSISRIQMEGLIEDCAETLRDGRHKIIATGLGKNVPICEKFVGTMLSLGLNAGFLNTNSAIHGDMGMVRPGDLVIILTKSGATEESIYLAELLKKREGVKLWLLSFNPESILSGMIEKKLLIHLEDEGDLWNIMPNNSTTLNLIVLQTVANELARKLNLSLEEDFRPNHPGGAIGAKMRYGK
ncbi:SIS domain-containing protein [Schwartzia succinivorans]|jgi:D-arabinose 5-phosphate isomerase GutQ/GTP:adenosylcobinamide-phosphate guanylyltransferase|uniref:D-arabinose 5-phosphate isomerase GutQ n=1 Tax=Schwartzia succinivorans DSM 10502 TaxID=1123243 RepID=A0A1M4SLG8_9FIRM|nr:SIS domain-containing protein [Schwartzia succinivorans]SHE33002.1 D-arabinose 5-phosphate isomerase GutQ [Schwartzia succinivorans DSM 10502]